ncbi:MAG: hypothetical protein R3A13_01095 [Bdellovibrionota bacterium]
MIFSLSSIAKRWGFNKFEIAALERRERLSALKGLQAVSSKGNTPGAEYILFLVRPDEREQFVKLIRQRLKRDLDNDLLKRIFHEAGLSSLEYTFL